MQYLYLRPPLSRCFAFVAAALVLATLYPMASKPRMTMATGLGFTAKEDHSDLRMLYLSPSVNEMKSSPLAKVEKKQNYEPKFAGFDRSIIGRVPDDSQGLDNNVPRKINIQQGQNQYWVFRKEILFGSKSAATGKPFPFESAPRDLLENYILGDISVEDESHNFLKRQDGSQESRMLSVSLTICDQPSLKDQSLKIEAQSLLTVYISLSSGNKTPGPGRSDLSFETPNGYGAKTIKASGDVFFGVAAAEDSNLDGVYNYELTASIDALYAAYNYDPYPEDYFMPVDSDSTSALFVLGNLTIGNPSTDRPPYSIFVYNIDDPTVPGIQRSLCGLQNHVQIKGNLLNGPSTSNVDTQLVRLDKGRQKQQFYVTGLNASTEYFAILAVDGNSTNDGGSVVRGGGTVGTPVPFRTKSDQNCAILYNLSFCTDVAYAVPFNPANSYLSNLTNLAALYDNNARNLYRNFSFARQQIPCNTTTAAQYSLARNCTDCDKAYKSWLCAVTIPRCEDFSSSSSWLQARAVSQPLHNGRPPLPELDPALSAENKTIRYMNSSRNHLIDDLIRPGPWKEILPCLQLCYDLVQSCPASMGFVCPLEDKSLKSYGSNPCDKNVTCNYPEKLGCSSNAAYTAANKVLISAVFGVVLLVHLGG